MPPPEVRADPVELTRLADTMLNASQHISDAWRAAQAAISLSQAKPGWFAMTRPYDPALEVPDPWEARVQCHHCEKSYLARETDRDPSAGHQAMMKMIHRRPKNGTFGAIGS